MKSRPSRARHNDNKCKEVKGYWCKAYGARNLALSCIWRSLVASMSCLACSCFCLRTSASLQPPQGLANYFLSKLPWCTHWPFANTCNQSMTNKEGDNKYCLLLLSIIVLASFSNGVMTHSAHQSAFCMRIFNAHIVGAQTQQFARWRSARQSTKAVFRETCC